MVGLCQQVTNAQYDGTESEFGQEEGVQLPSEMPVKLKHGAKCKT